jgi:hypothetical protein
MRYAIEAERIYGFGSSQERDEWIAAGNNRRPVAGTSREVKKAVYEDQIVFVETVADEEAVH